MLSRILIVTTWARTAAISSWRYTYYYKGKGWAGDHQGEVAPRRVKGKVTLVWIDQIETVTTGLWASYYRADQLADFQLQLIIITKGLWLVVIAAAAAWFEVVLPLVVPVIVWKTPWLRRFKTVLPVCEWGRYEKGFPLQKNNMDREKGDVIQGSRAIFLSQIQEFSGYFRTKCVGFSGYLSKKICQINIKKSSSQYADDITIPSPPSDLSTAAINA